MGLVESALLHCILYFAGKSGEALGPDESGANQGKTMEPLDGGSVEGEWVVGFGEFLGRRLGGDDAKELGVDQGGHGRHGFAADGEGGLGGFEEGGVGWAS